MQNLYNRKRQPRTFKTAVLENRHLCATFLLEMGGRLWSIVDKRTGRELLYKNPVFQPANLGARDAWFSGGVEWNIGTVNHSAQLCEPIFAARLQKADGTPVLQHRRAGDRRHPRAVTGPAVLCLPLRPAAHRTEPLPRQRAARPAARQRAGCD
jgi:hypothetical protein